MDIAITKNEFGIYVVPEMENEELCNAVTLFSGEIVRYLDRYKNDVELINLDPNLSEVGKKKKIETLKPNSEKAMADFARRATNLLEQYKPLVDAARNAKKYVSKDRLLDELRGRETRDLLRAQGNTAIVTAYLNPKGDGFIRWSIEQSPLPMISDLEILRRGREGVIGEENVRFITDVREFMSILKNVIELACSYLKITVPTGVSNLTKI